MWKGISQNQSNSDNICSAVAIWTRPTSAKIFSAAATRGVIKIFFLNPVTGRMNGYCQKNPLYPVLKISMSHFSFCKTQTLQSFPFPFWSSEQTFEGNKSPNSSETCGMQLTVGFIQRVFRQPGISSEKWTTLLWRNKISWRWKCWLGVGCVNGL